MKKKIFILLLICLFVITGCGKEEKKDNKKNKEKVNVVEKKVTIIDEDSNSRTYAVVINNFPRATKVQSGLNEAYMIYEFPIEGGITRSLALFKDKKDVKIGTVRSARHNYLDYVLENDAIFVHFGWSKSAMLDISKLGIDYIDGNTRDSKPFWRENPESLPTEHTVYTNLKNIIEYNETVRKFDTTTNVKAPLKYTVDNIDFSKDEDAKIANNVELVQSGAYKVKYVYNAETKRYDRFINGEKHIDYFTKDVFDTKNIIVTLLDWGVVKEYADMAGNNYLDLYNIGEGKGYYITNGYAKEITWNKTSRDSQTVYKYLNGEEIKVNDGNTYVMFQSKNIGVSFS